MCELRGERRLSRDFWGHVGEINCDAVRRVCGEGIWGTEVTVQVGLADYCIARKGKDRIIRYELSDNPV